MLIHSAPGAKKGSTSRMISSLYEHLPGDWAVKRTDSGSMNRETFLDWAKYFVKVMEEDGYGKCHGHPMVLLLDGHTSRWDYVALRYLIDHGFFPFFIASHTSAWHQPNDCGLNATYKAKYKAAVKQWRLKNPYATFDRVAFNQCCVQASIAVEINLASELAASDAKKTAWEQLGSPPELAPRGKKGNVVTRMYERTGWYVIHTAAVIHSSIIDLPTQQVAFAERFRDVDPGH